MRPIPDIDAPGMAFGEIGHLPEMSEIPKEFQDENTKWNEIVSRWFYSGLPKETELTPKEGVDPKKALRAIGAILRSWGPKHEHKMAGTAYLMSEWFDDVVIPK